MMRSDEGTHRSRLLCPGFEGEARLREGRSVRLRRSVCWPVASTRIECHSCRWIDLRMGWIQGQGLNDLFPRRSSTQHHRQLTGAHVKRILGLTR